MYTQQQMKELQSNSNVQKCSKTSITYKKEFKILAVKQYFDEGLSPNMIFREAGLSYLIPKELPDKCLGRWRKTFNSLGEEGLGKERRGRKGGRKKKKVLKSDKDRISYLEDKVAYLEAENDFLALLRGIKRE